MEEIKETGGAIIGGVRILWPFVTLIVNQNKLQLNGSIYSTLVFRPEDIISIETTNKLFNNGILIKHNVPGYNPHVIFLTPHGHELVDKIRAIGFIGNKTRIPAKIEKEFADIQDNGASPLKVSAGILILLLWNILVLGNKFILPGEYDDDIPFTGLEAAFMLTLVIALLLLLVKPFRQVIIKPGRQLSDFRSFIYFTAVISFLLIILLIFFPK